MRFHRRYPLLQTWMGLPALQSLVSAENLCVARFEPAIFQMAGSGIVDLIFCAGEAMAVVPYIEVSSAMLLQRENTPVTWPAACAPVGAKRLQAIEAAILPWLESLTLARQLNIETVRRFSENLDEDAFTAARSAGFLGASPYRDAAARWAPYIYAMRFIDGNAVAVRGAWGGTGAALCASRTAAILADLGGAERNALAQRWFGRSIFDRTPDHADVAIYEADAPPVSARITIAPDRTLQGAREIEVAQPVPSDVLISFNAEDSWAAGSFSVRANERLRSPRGWGGVQEPRAAGGSSGNILLVLRDDWMRAPDADVDEAKAIAARLELEGFNVTLSPASTAAGASKRADLVHAFSISRAPECLEPLKSLKSRGVPIVVTPALSRMTSQSLALPNALRRLFLFGDEAHLAENLERLDASVEQPFLGRDEICAEMIALADAVIAGGPVEEHLIRTQYGYSGPVIASRAYVRDHGVESIEAFLGCAEYVFAHTRIDARSNLAMLARAAAEQSRALVVAGPVVDFDVYRTLREILGDRFCHAPRPSDAEVAAMYRNARVFADVSWWGYGASRASLASTCGCSLVLSTAMPDCATLGAAEANPARIGSIRNALARAWDTPAPRLPSDPNQAFLALISAYAQAQRAAAPA